jgi:hypothetical protein
MLSAFMVGYLIKCGNKQVTHVGKQESAMLLTVLKLDQFIAKLREHSVHEIWYFRAVNTYIVVFGF